MRFGRYQVTREIGSGGFATVYLADDPVLGSVAIKVLNDRRAADTDIRKRFADEASIMRGLAGKFLVAVHDFGDEDGKLFFVMEYCERGTLADRLVGPHETVSLGEALQLARFLADAMARVHKAGIVHRDLKLANLLVRKTKSGDRTVIGDLLHHDEELVLTDFGLAKFIDPSATRLSVAMGTPGFGAPEQFQGVGSVDARADIYAASAIIVAIMSGANPEREVTVGGDVFSEAAIAATGPLQTELARGLSFDRSGRHSTITEWYQSLAAAAAPVTESAAGSPTVSRHANLLGGVLAGLIAAALAGTIAVLAFGDRSADDTTGSTLASPTISSGVAQVEQVGSIGTIEATTSVDTVSTPTNPLPADPTPTSGTTTSTRQTTTTGSTTTSGTTDPQNCADVPALMDQAHLERNTLKNYPRAIELYEAAIDCEPTALAYLSLAGAFALDKRDEEAEPYYRAALQLDASSIVRARSLGELAGLLLRRDDYTAAIDFATQSIAVESEKFPTAWSTRATAHEKLGQFDEALIDRTKMVELVPNHWWHHYARGVVYVELGLIAEARADFNNALEVEPTRQEPQIALTELG